MIEPLSTLLDIASLVDDYRLERAVNEADKLGLLRCDDALRQLAERPGRKNIRRLLSILTRHTATDSELERRFLRIARAAGLPRPQTQAVVEGYRVDFLWRDLRLVVETDGLTYHRTPAQQARDRERDQVLTAAGLTCLRFTNAQVRRSPRHVERTLIAVAARQLGG